MTILVPTAGITWLAAVRRVQCRLRVPQATSVTDGTDYDKLIGELVNQAKREVEDSWDWTPLRRTITISTTANDASLTIDTSNHRSRIARGQTNEPVIYNRSKDQIIRPMPRWFYERETAFDNTQNGDPVFYTPIGSSSRQIVLKLWPTPNSVMTIEVPITVPQDDLASDSTIFDIAGVVDAIVLRAYILALEERGDDGGTAARGVQEAYTKALYDAISFDSIHTQSDLMWLPY